MGQTIANTITADYISSKIASIPLLSVQAIALSGGLSSTSGDIRTGGTVGGASLYLGAQNMEEAIVSASVSGNVLTLTNVKGESVTFSKATSLSGAWSGGTLTVSASPQGNSWTTAIKSLAAADVTWSGVTGTFNVQAYNNGAEVAVNTGRSMTVTAPFTQTTVTLQGAQETVYAEMESGGSDYYTADTAVTYYQSGAQYKAVTRYKGGSAITKQGAVGPKLAHYGSQQLYYKSGNEYKAAGSTRDWYYASTDSGSVQYYKAGSAATEQGASDTVLVPIEEGETGSYFLRGSSVSVTPINTASKKHLVSTIRYKAGSSATYYTMNTPPEEEEE